MILRPIVHRDEYTLALERVVRDEFWETLFFPLFDLMKTAGVVVDARENAPGKPALVRALESGRVWYAEGTFSGKFNAAISRELRAAGATFNPEAGTFSLPLDKLPIEIRGAVGDSAERARDLHADLGGALDAIEANALGRATTVQVGKTVDRVVADLNSQFKGTVKALDAVEIPYEPELLASLRKPLVENLDLSVKKFTAAEVVELRELVQENAAAGYRTDRLAKLIEARWGVTKRKAAFLADQETGLLVAKYREARYKAIGSNRYKWSTSHDDRVRPDHARLNGKIFDWDSPPITNRQTGATNHPGEDFRCRCVAMPLIEGLGETAVRDNARPVFRCATP